jgi:hypothetical protein
MKWFLGLIKSLLKGGIETAVTTAKNNPEVVVSNPQSVILPSAIGVAKEGIEYVKDGDESP